MLNTPLNVETRPGRVSTFRYNTQNGSFWYLPKIRSDSQFGAHCVVIGPAIDSWRFDPLLAEQRGDLRAMIDGVVDGLDYHDDDRSIIRSCVQMQDRIQILWLRLLHEVDQCFARSLC